MRLAPSIPEQLGTDEGDKVLQQLVGGADQEVGAKCPDQSPEEGGLAGGRLLLGQQHLCQLGPILHHHARRQMVSGTLWRRLGVHRLGGRALLTGARETERKRKREREREREKERERKREREREKERERERGRQRQSRERERESEWQCWK